MPILIYDTREIHKNHVRCGHAGAVPDPKAQHQLSVGEREGYGSRASTLSLSLSINIAGRGETQSGLSSTL